MQQMEWMREKTVGLVRCGVERLVQASVYRPPAVNYLRNACLFAQTRDGDSVAMRLYSPDTRVVTRFSYGEGARSENDVFIFSHGNGSDIGATHRFCEHLSSALHVDVLVYDYPQYGHSSGTQASQAKMFASIDAVFVACLQNGWTQSRIFLLGHSLGSVPTVYRAAQAQCRVSGVVLLAPLASGARVLLQERQNVPQWVLRRLDWVLFDNMAEIGKVACPIAIVHGKDDTTVTVEHSHLLKKHIAPESQYPTLLLETGHNEVVDVCSRDLLKITEYIRKFRDGCQLARAGTKNEKNEKEA